VAAALNSLQWRLNGTTSNENSWRLDAEGELSAEGITAGTGQLPTMLQTGGLTARLVVPEPGDLLALDSLAVSELQLLERSAPAAEDAAHLLELSAMNVGGLTFAPGELAVGITQLNGLQIWLERSQEGVLELDAVLAGDADEMEVDALEAPTPAADEMPSSVLNYSLAGLKTGGDSRLMYVDRSVRPVVKLELQPLDLELGRLDSTQPDVNTPFSLKASQDRYGSVAFSGQLRPLGEQAFLQGGGSIRDLNMIALNGFARRTLGYRISAGTMSADVDVGLQAGRLDSEADLTIRRLTIDPLQADEHDEFSTELGVPLGTALGLLEDDEETIRLNIPLQGQLAQLSVGMGDAIRLVVQKGLMAGLQTAATTYFAPLWPALAANKLFAVATQLKFEDITFTAAASELGGEQLEYISNMATLLAKRSKVSLSLCGRAVAADVAALFPGSVGELSAEQQATLTELAQRRHEAVKDQLIAAGVASDRLVTCTPAARPADNGAPRVDFGT